jgi:hypothetical protein
MNGTGAGDDLAPFPADCNQDARSRRFFRALRAACRVPAFFEGFS